jgi:hypothetical protein
MVIGFFPTPDHAAVCLSNLAEEGFAPGDISIIMKTPGAAAALAETSGRLNAVPVASLPAALVDLGLTLADAQAYRDGVERGGVFIAVAAPDADDAAKETLQDHQAERIRIVQTPPRSKGS